MVTTTRGRFLLSFLAAGVAATLAMPAPAGEPPKTMTGQVVCGGCWDEVPDRRKDPYGTQADMECAARCEKQGVAAALAVDDGKTFTIYELAPGAYKPAKGSWLPLMGKRAEVMGSVKPDGKKQKLTVDALKVLPDEKG